MKNKKTNKNVQAENMQCAVCSARFKMWLDNSGLKEDRQEKISEHLLEYCPACSKSVKK